MNRAIAAGALLLVASFARAAKIEQRTLTSKGVKRTYALFVPDSVTKDHPAPLIVTLHGSGRDGKSLVSSWQSLAEKEGIVLAGPDSNERAGWAMPVDGPVFLRDVVEDVKASVPIDEHRVYLFGHSAGAGFGLLMALAESEYFAAVAVHAGAMAPESYPMIQVAKRKIEFQIFIGDRDPYFPLAEVRATRDELLESGFAVELIEMKGHDHDYYSFAKSINERAWSFLKSQALAQPQKFTVYANM
jgi:poly(3-hydroxybutyrate) depolymerase